jgi:hypothetical protein
MESFENDELSESELDAVLRQWQSPLPPAHLRESIFPPPAPWWRRIWAVRIPLPVACAVLALIALASWCIPRFAPPPPPPRAPQVVVRTERVEVPVQHERVVTRYIYRRAPSHELTFEQLKPVAELRPRIIRSNDAQH